MTEELNGKVNQTLDAVGQLIGIVQELVSVTQEIAETNSESGRLLSERLVALQLRVDDVEMPERRG